MNQLFAEHGVRLYIMLSTLVFWIFFASWGKSSYLNLLVKILFLFLGLFGLYILMKEAII